MQIFTKGCTPDCEKFSLALSLLFFMTLLGSMLNCISMPFSFISALNATKPIEVDFNIVPESDSVSVGGGGGLIFPPPCGLIGTESEPASSLLTFAVAVLSGEAVEVWRAAAARASASRGQRPCNECGIALKHLKPEALAQKFVVRDMSCSVLFEVIINLDQGRIVHPCLASVLSSYTLKSARHPTIQHEFNYNIVKGQAALLTYHLLQ